MGGEGDARDHGALGAGGLGYQQESRTSATCATPKPFPVHEDASPFPPFKHAAPEETATAEDYVRTGRQAADLHSSAYAGQAPGRHW